MTTGFVSWTPAASGQVDFHQLKRNFLKLQVIEIQFTEMYLTILLCRTEIESTVLSFAQIYRRCDMQFIVNCKFPSQFSLITLLFFWYFLRVENLFRPIKYFSRIRDVECRSVRNSFQIRSCLWTCWMSTKSNSLSAYTHTHAHTIKQSTHPAKSYQ